MGFIKELFKQVNQIKSDIVENVNQTSKSVISNVNIDTHLEPKTATTKDKTIKDLYAKTLFLYANNSCKKVGNKKDYVGYIEYECGIINPNLYHNQLIGEGYFVKASPKDRLSLLKVPELKEILRNNGKELKGNKEDLINRIIAEVEPNHINVLSDINEYYILSDKGKSFLKENNDFVEIHRHQSWAITLEEYSNAIKGVTYKQKFNDIAWKIFNERILKFDVNDFSNLRFNYFHMGELLLDEGKFQQALNLFLYCLIYDFSGAESLDVINNYKSIYVPFNVSSPEFLIKLLNEVFNATIFDFDKLQEDFKKMKINYILKMIK